MDQTQPQEKKKTQTNSVFNLSHLFIKLITKAVEANPKFFPVDTKKVQCIGEDNQVVANHIQDVVVSENISKLPFSPHTAYLVVLLDRINTQQARSLISVVKDMFPI